MVNTTKNELVMSKDNEAKAEACLAESLALYTRVINYYNEANCDDKRSLALVADKAMEHDAGAIQELSELFSIEHERNALVAALAIQCEAYGGLEVLSENTLLSAEGR